MKELKKLAICVICFMGLKSQAQSDTEPKHDCIKLIPWKCNETVHGVVENIHFKDCNDDIFITVSKNDNYITRISGFLETTKAIHIKPNDGTIKITPLLGTSCSDNHNAHPKKKTHNGTRIGSKEEVSRKSDNDSIIIYPNPVETQLAIESVENLLSYTIINSIGETSLEGEFTSKTISVEKLPIGLYHIQLQTTNKVVSKTFIKN